METDVSARDLRNHTARVLDDIEHGTTVYITRNGERVAMLTPLRRARHPANQRLLDLLAATRPENSGWLDEYLEDKRAVEDDEAERDRRIGLA